MSLRPDDDDDGPLMSPEVLTYRLSDLESRRCLALHPVCGLCHAPCLCFNIISYKVWQCRILAILRH